MKNFMSQQTGGIYFTKFLFVKRLHIMCACQSSDGKRLTRAGVAYDYISPEKLETSELSRLIETNKT